MWEILGVVFSASVTCFLVTMYFVIEYWYITVPVALVLGAWAVLPTKLPAVNWAGMTSHSCCGRMFARA